MIFAVANMDSRSINERLYISRIELDCPIAVHDCIIDGIVLEVLIDTILLEVGTETTSYFKKNILFRIERDRSADISQGFFVVCHVYSEKTPCIVCQWVVLVGCDSPIEIFQCMVVVAL